jgi:ribosomal protein L7/L12
MATEVTDDQWKRIDLELAAGRKIDAIKLHREFAGSDLKDAKDAVEAHLKELLEKNPTRYAAAVTGKGCMQVLILTFLPLIYVLIQRLE